MQLTTVIVGAVAALAAYGVYKVLMRPVKKPISNNQGGSLASKGRQVGTIPLPQGIGRVSLPNNTSDVIGGLFGANQSAPMNPLFKPYGALPANPSAGYDRTNGLADPLAKAAAAGAPAAFKALSNVNLSGDPTPDDYTSNRIDGYDSPSGPGEQPTFDGVSSNNDLNPYSYDNYNVPADGSFAPDSSLAGMDPGPTWS